MNASAKVHARGESFNGRYSELVDGALVVSDRTIAPKDVKNATVFLSADGLRLLAWDPASGSVASKPYREATIVQGRDGGCPCASLCPAP